MPVVCGIGLDLKCDHCNKTELGSKAFIHKIGGLNDFIMFFAVSAISQPNKRELCDCIYSSINACIFNFAHVHYDNFI